MASKYAAVFPKLKEMPVQDTSRQAQVDVVKTAITKDGIPDGMQLAQRFAFLRGEKQKIELQLKDIDLALEAFFQMLVESSRSDDPAWGAYGVPKNTIRLASGEKIAVQPEPKAVLEDPEANRHWAMENGYERLLRINWSTLNAMVKERLLKGDKEPPGVGVYVYYKPVFTKAGEIDAE
jgi:hypothetical protein